MSGKKRNVMLFILLFTLLLGVIVPVQAQSYGGTKTIRVAYREDADFINKSSSGVYKGYGVEYLNKISQYYESDQVFLKHMPPFDPIGNENHMHQQLVRYMRKAGIDQRTKKHSGFHSLRHSAGSMLLEMETPLPVITDILGHSNSDVTAVYLKTDLQKLAECVLSPEGFRHG